jgi:hypothetical protein
MVQVARRRRANTIPRRGAAQDIRRATGVDEATRRLLQYVVVPLWIGSGLADWLCHRRTNIETTAGVEESAIHALMMAQAGIPSTLGLFLEVNAGVIAMTLAAFGLHQATAIWDVAYADERRRVTPTEQHVHGLLEQGPAMATACLVVLHWDQACALVGLGPERPVWKPQLKRRPLSRGYRVGFLASVAGLVALPYGEELWRCWRNRGRVVDDERAADDQDLL